jgi:glycosyltransferase involved in cell wall biosynthesis
MPAVSICIPTYKRPELLKLALESCLAQTFADFEIVIGDDSPDSQSAEKIRALRAPQPIRYFRNLPRAGQARNVNQLFAAAQGEFFVLLHDDDVLLPNALDTLIKPLQQNPTLVASFGKQLVINNDGDVLRSESESLNRKYCRTDQRANRVQRSAWAALVQQLPCDGYMVRTAAARTTLYRDDPEVGQACDADFGYRLMEQGDFFFLGEFTSAYRITPDSISTSGLRIHLSKLYFILKRLTVPGDLENVRRARLEELAPPAVSGCILRAARSKALSILFGPHYPWSRKPVKGSIQLGLVFLPRLVSGIFLK